MKSTTRSEVVTEDIRVEVCSLFVPEHSDAEKKQYFFAYRIKITNIGDVPARLLRRHWEIQDALGLRETVDGPGVVGERPRLGPDEFFEYTSACPLATPLGTMEGYYEMVRDDGSLFKVAIGRFLLLAPYVGN